MTCAGRNMALDGGELGKMASHLLILCNGLCW